MCLILQEDKKLIAEEDIVCYKVATVWYKSKNGIRTKLEMKTPFQKCTVELNKTYDSKLIVEKVMETFTIHIGIHSFITKEGAEKLCNHLNRFLEYYKVIECVIPKGSEYYVGRFFSTSSRITNPNSYASNKLTYKTIIE